MSHLPEIMSGAVAGLAFLLACLGIMAGAVGMTSEEGPWLFRRIAGALAVLTPLSGLLWGLGMVLQ